MKVHQAAGGVLKDKFEGDGKDKIEKAVLDPPRSLVWRCEKKMTSFLPVTNTMFEQISQL